MARPRQPKNLVNRLADVGEEAIQRIGGAPGADRLVGAVNTLRDRMDEVQKRLRGLDALEKQIKSLERRVDKLEGKGTSRSGSSAARKSTTTRRKKT